MFTVFKFFGWSLFACFAWSLLRVFIKTCQLFYRVLFCSGYDFHQTHLYGPPENTWVLVTGATDGLGWEYCRKFAEMNYNILLVSRTLSKLEQKSKILESDYNVHTAVIRADFTECMEDSNYFKKIQTKINNLNIDIGIVVNNVGQLNLDFQKTSVKDSINMNIVNTIPQIAFTLDMLSSFHKGRVHKSAIIDIGSIASLVPRSEIYHYSATKRFVQSYTLGKAMSNTNPDEIDWILVRPAWVSTQMINKRNLDLLTCTPEETVDGTCRCLGKVMMIYGSRKHEFLGYALEVGTMFVGYAISKFIIYGVILEAWNFIFGVQQEDIYDRTINNNKKEN